jgi:hypothetical protein
MPEKNSPRRPPPPHPVVWSPQVPTLTGWPASLPMGLSELPELFSPAVASLQPGGAEYKDKDEDDAMAASIVDYNATLAFNDDEGGGG